MNLLSEFYAVTHNSVYLVEHVGDDTSCEVMMRKLLPDEGEDVSKGLKLCIFRDKIFLFNPGSPKGKYSKLENLKNLNVGYITSPFIGLFDNKEAAEDCWSRRKSEADPAWAKSTKNIIDMIGPKHPSMDLYETDLRW